MKTNKFLQLILCLFFITISCKKKDSTSYKILEKKQEYKTSNSGSNTNNDSFVLSCGSGCAMTYTLQILQQDKYTINVKFKVETYIDEELSDTYYEKYNFWYNHFGEIEKINKEGDNDNVLQNLMPDAQIKFKKFSKLLLKNKNVDISKFSKKEKTNIDNNIKVCVLPFDFTDYYNICIENDKGCEIKYPSYIYPEYKNILESYGVKEQPSAFFILPRIHNLQPIILAFTDSDIEGYIFEVIDNKKVVSSLQIGKMDGEKIEDFIIKENYEIELYSRKNSAEKRVLKRIYRVQKDGLIK
ncbi:hypothetical protein [Chryseobacterium potabilaquae]|uniref:Lipoprotein n=1 Tax=Chryseobacterium potabilaquae TaxID=2675057 RepID=A0A6N4XAM6_9FLAO|nr:hypothetical protein [Chryseobacterium potabilaquae]CAA7197351.1 hypothetical protein CHRY9293_03406 [Chryseobacterium potabilaquae]